MKYRIDFVTNSSSSSSVVLVFKMKDKAIVEINYEVEHLFVGGIKEKHKSYNEIIEAIILSKQFELISNVLEPEEFNYGYIDGGQTPVLFMDNIQQYISENHKDEIDAALTAVVALEELKQDICINSYEEFISFPVWEYLDINKPTNIHQIIEETTDQTDDGDYIHEIVIEPESLNVESKTISPSFYEEEDDYDEEEDDYDEDDEDDYDEEEVILEKLKQDGLALEFVEERFKEKKEFALAAVRENPLAIDFIAKKLLEDKELCQTIYDIAKEAGLYLDESIEEMKAPYQYIRGSNDIKPTNFGNLWSQKDFDYLHEMYKKEVRLDQIANTLGRDILGCIYQLSYSSDWNDDDTNKLISFYKKSENWDIVLAKLEINSKKK